MAYVSTCHIKRCYLLFIFGGPTCLATSPQSFLTDMASRFFWKPHTSDFARPGPKNNANDHMKKRGRWGFYSDASCLARLGPKKNGTDEHTEKGYGVVCIPMRYAWALPHAFVFYLSITMTPIFLEASYACLRGRQYFAFQKRGPIFLGGSHRSGAIRNSDICNPGTVQTLQRRVLEPVGPSFLRRVVPGPLVPSGWDPY